MINERTPGREGVLYKEGDCLVKRLTRSVTDENTRRTYPNNQNSPDQTHSAHQSCQHIGSVIALSATAFLKPSLYSTYSIFIHNIYFSSKGIRNIL